MEATLRQIAGKLQYDSTQVEATASRICMILSEAHPGRIMRHKLAGSVGKQTALDGSPGPDLDLVIFVKAEPPFKSVLKDFQETLEKASDFKDIKFHWDPEKVEYESTITESRVTRYAVQFKLGNLDVDLLAAAWFSDDVKEQRRKTVEKMQPLFESKTHWRASFYNTSLCESTVQFMRCQNQECLALIRLAKSWAKHKDMAPFSGKSYILELTSIFVAQQFEEQHQHVHLPLFDSFRKLMELLSNFDKMCVVTKHGLESFPIPLHITNKTPLIMDPVNPFNNLCFGYLDRSPRTEAIREGIKGIERSAMRAIHFMNTAKEDDVIKWFASFCGAPVVPSPRESMQMPVRVGMSVGPNLSSRRVGETLTISARHFDMESTKTALMGQSDDDIEFEDAAVKVLVRNEDFHRIATPLLKDGKVVDPKNLSRLYSELGLHEAYYQAMRKKHEDAYDFLKDVLAEWVSLKSKEATWYALYKALLGVELNNGADIVKELFKTKS